MKKENFFSWWKKEGFKSAWNKMKYNYVMSDTPEYQAKLMFKQVRNSLIISIIGLLITLSLVGYYAYKGNIFLLLFFLGLCSLQSFGLKESWTKYKNFKELNKQLLEVENEFK